MEFDMNFVYNAWAPELDGEKVFSQIILKS